MKLFSVLAAVAGLCLIAALVFHFGPHAVTRTLIAVGWTGFAAVCSIHLALMAVMGIAWGVLIPGTSLWVPVWGRLVRDSGSELLPLSQEEQLAVIPFNPLAGGLLTGKYRHDETPDQGRFSAELGTFGALYHARYWNQRQFETIGNLQAIVTETGEPLTKLAVAWILANPAITSVILGASRG